MTGTFSTELISISHHLSFPTSIYFQNLSVLTFERPWHPMNLSSNLVPTGGPLTSASSSFQHTQRLAACAHSRNVASIVVLRTGRLTATPIICGQVARFHCTRFPLVTESPGSVSSWHSLTLTTMSCTCLSVVLHLSAMTSNSCRSPQPVG